MAIGNKVLIDRTEYDELVSSSRRSIGIANECFDAFELMRKCNEKMSLLASALLNERKKQIKKEEALRKRLSDFPLFEGEIEDPPQNQIAQ